MKRLFFAICTLAAALASTASTTVDLQGKIFSVDTLQHYYLANGVTHTHLKLAGDGATVHVYAVTTDVTADERTDFSVVIGNDSCRTGEAITSMARRKADADTRYIAGINADFFITSAFAAQHEFGNQILGYPNMSCFIDGKIAAPDMIDVVSRENALVIGSEGWWIDATDLKYRLLNNDGSTVVDAKAINYPRRSNEMMLYNSYAGGWTKTDNTGRELTLVPVDGATWRTNASVKMKVSGSWRQGGNSPIPADGLVISCGPGYSNEWVDALSDGDIVKVKIVCSLPAFDNLRPDVRHVVGGDVRILKEDVVTTEAIRWINTPSARYARSLVGYDKDRTRMVMCAVDGNAASSGLNYYESADLMRFLGCYDALDFDGGGSTAIWSEAKGMLNSPRDGAERAVGNGMFVTLKAPVDDKVASIRFADYALTMPLYGTYKPVIYGYNQYGQLVDTNVADFTLEVADAALGSIVDGTTLLADGEAGTYALRARLGDADAVIAVTVDNSVPAHARYAQLLIDNISPVTVELVAEVLGHDMPVAARAFSWTSSNPAIVEIDDEGVLTGHTDGTAVVTGTCGDLTVDVAVTVQCPTDLVMAIDPDFSAENWTVGTTGVKNVTVTPLDNGFALDYKITSTRGTRLSMTRNIDLWSLPEAVRVRVKPAEGVKISAMTLNLRPDNVVRNIAVKADTLLVAGEENIIDFHIGEFADTADPGIWPIHFASVSFELSNSTGDYHFDVPGLETIYNNVSVDGVEPVSVSAPARLAVKVSGNTLQLGCEASRIEVYSVSGALVAAGRGSEITLPEGRGAYVVAAVCGGMRLAARVIL